MIIYIVIIKYETYRFIIKLSLFPWYIAYIVIVSAFSDAFAPISTCIQDAFISKVHICIYHSTINITVHDDIKVISAAWDISIDV